MRFSLKIFILLCLCVATYAAEPVRLYVIGDSTAAAYAGNRAPLTGWAQVLQAQFDPAQLQVIDKAISGRSSKSFYEEGSWAPVREALRTGDYVFIQFGHNDQKKDDPKRYTIPETSYTGYLNRYITETRAKGAIPVLVTSINRNTWASESELLDSMGGYPQATRDLAVKEGLALIDLHLHTKRLYESLGPVKVRDLFLYLEKGEHPNYPDGKNDGTHLSFFGARQVSKLAVTALREQSHPLAAYLKKSSTRNSAMSLNSIQTENALQGDPNWQLTYTRVDPETKFRCPWIEGYVSRASIKAGESLDIMVSTNAAAPFKIDIYRMGYYGGAGARHILELGPFEGVTQPDPPIGEKRLRECDWTPCHSLTIPEDWVSGVYLGKLTLLEGRCQSYIIFIVTDDRKADVLFQCSDNTWQAYNRWPDNFALYDDGENEWYLGGGTDVGYDRPYGKYCQIIDAPLSQGSGEFLLWEFPLAYWLEREGYDVTYCSNTDIHADPLCAQRGKVFLSVGHDEYWSLEQYAHVKAAIEAGTDVGFLSANTACFVAPYQSNSKGVPNRVINRAERYGGLREEEKAIMGPFTSGIEAPDEADIIGARTVYPFNGSGDWNVVKADHWLFEGTGMKNGDGIPGIVGWEFHGDPASIPGLEIVAQGTAINGGGQHSDWCATIYPGPKDNWVFNASTIYWAQGLSSPPGHMLPYVHNGRPHGTDPRVQGITRNFLSRCLR